jgi:hypothetical protein
MGRDQLVPNLPPVLPCLSWIGIGANRVIEVGDPSPPVEQCPQVPQRVVLRGELNIIERRGSDQPSLAAAFQQAAALTGVRLASA